jgi:phosphoserine phosphatase
MPIAVMMCCPRQPRLTEADVAALCARWRGGAPRWLNPGIAAEFRCDGTPEDWSDIWKTLQDQGIDLALVPEQGRRKRLLIADMDSTMIGQECIDELADLAGFGAQVAAVTARAMNGELAFEPALRARVALFAGADAGLIDRTWAERIRMTPGGATLIATMKAHGARCALVSGGFTAFTARVAAALGFDEHRANILHTDGPRLTGTVAEPILGREAKVAALTGISARLGISPADALAVGDGANDLGMLHLAGMGVALHAKPSVQAQVDLRVNHGDLTALLYLQGYAVDAFVQVPDPVPNGGRSDG